jgi:hypothetical protein
MIIGNNVQGTARDKINNMRGEKVDEMQGNLGSLYRKDDMVKDLLPKVDMEEIDPDNRGTDYEDEKDDYYLTGTVVPYHHHDGQERTYRHPATNRNLRCTRRLLPLRFH